jgi:hypothetical protein
MAGHLDGASERLEERGDVLFPDELASPGHDRVEVTREAHVIGEAIEDERDVPASEGLEENLLDVRLLARRAPLVAASETTPTLPSIAGELREGSTLSLTLGMPGRPSPKVKARLSEVLPRQRLSWHGNMGAEWLFAGDRQFVIDSGQTGGVHFTHAEDVRGALFPLFRAVMGSVIQRSHDAFNAALKRRAEELAAQRAPSP